MQLDDLADLAIGDRLVVRTPDDLRKLRLAGLRASGLNHHPLAQALSELCQEIKQLTSLEIICRIAPAVELSQTMTEALWRVIQETLMNVEKHAAAHRVWIDLDVKPAAVVLRVADDGIGLPPNLPSRPGHYGLQGMRERIEGLGGILTVGSNGQTGTMIEASLPVIGSSEYPREDLMSYGHDSHSAGRGSNANAAGSENDP